MKAGSTEPPKVETPDAAPTTSEKEKLEPLVVAADGPEGVAAKKANRMSFDCQSDAEAEKLHKSCIRKLPHRTLIVCSFLRYYPSNQSMLGAEVLPGLASVFEALHLIGLILHHFKITEFSNQ